MPANVFEWDGWQGQYGRMRRWFDRLLIVANDWDSHGFDEQVDYALVFFHNSYHLRDYLLREGVVPQQALDELMHTSRPLRICRDLTNGSKHRLVTSPSEDASPWVHRTLNFGPEPRLTLKADPELLDLVSVAASCLETWDRFLDQHGLDSSSVSPARQALFDALRTGATDDVADRDQGVNA